METNTRYTLTWYENGTLQERKSSIPDYLKEFAKSNKLTGYVISKVTTTYEDIEKG